MGGFNPTSFQSPRPLSGMALVQPSDPDQVAPGFPGLGEAELGAVAEDRLATAIQLQAPGIASVARPLLDLGFDLYLRRIRTLRAHPLQVKARSFLGPDGQFEVGVSSLHLDPAGYVVLPYVPPPDWQLTGKLWAIPIPEFVRLAQRDGDGYIFSSYFGRAVTGPENAFLVDVDKLNTQWVTRIAGWKTAVHGPELTGGSAEEVARPETRALGRSGELWLASQLMRTGLSNFVIAQDRLRVDCVSILLHDLRSFAMAGLVIHVSSVDARGHLQFQIRHQTFFVDGRLHVVVLVFLSDGTLHDTAFLIPSAELPSVATRSVDRGGADYHGNHRLDPLAPKLKPYAISTQQLAAAILERL